MQLRKFVYFFMVILSLLVLVFFVFRDNLLSWAFDKVRQKVKNQYHITLTAQSISFSQLENINIRQVVAVPDSADTILTVNSIKLNVSITDLLLGNIGFDEIQCDTFAVNLYNEPLRKNVSFLTRKKQTSDTLLKNTNAELNYNEMLQRIAGKAFRILNTRFVMNDFNIHYKDSLHEERLKIPNLNFDKKRFEGILISYKEVNNDTLLFTGEVLKRNQIYSFSITDNSIDKNYLPFLDVDKKPRARFGTISGTITFEKGSSLSTLKVDITATDIHINHWRLAEEDVIFPSIQIKGIAQVEKHRVTLDSLSVIKLNHAQVNVYLKHESSPKRLFEMKISMPETASDSFFTSLPGGMFRTLKGIKTKGTLSYKLIFEIDKDHPEQLIFDSSLKKKNLRITQFGAEDYSRIDTTFLFDALDGDRLVRTIMVGAENPVFTPLDQISPYLKYAVMTSEDGSFMHHRGFNEDAFRESIITNYKAGRFLRGGSTITMQLVKNCFLSRDKTISRKAEEALIVWLIENNNLVSKERMLEVYLNVIEWGPDVYGIGEASGFYFGKQPGELNLSESIYLASIIPHPKYFKYSFDSTGTLKPFLAGYFNLVSSKMLGRNWITPQDTVDLRPNVKLIGPAKNFVLPPDTFSVPIDSILIEDIEQL